MNKRDFLKGLILFFPAGGTLGALARVADAKEAAPAKTEAAGAPRPEVLSRLSRLRSVATDRVPADQSDDAQPAEAVHLLPQSARPSAADGAAGMLGLPRADRADEVGVQPRAPGLHDLPHGIRAAQAGTADRAPVQASGPGVLR